MIHLLMPVFQASRTAPNSDSERGESDQTSSAIALKDRLDFLAVVGVLR
jgi:hypothetical protein